MEQSAPEVVIDSNFEFCSFFQNISNRMTGDKNGKEGVNLLLLSIYLETINSDLLNWYQSKQEFP